MLRPSSHAATPPPLRSALAAAYLVPGLGLATAHRDRLSVALLLAVVWILACSVPIALVLRDGDRSVLRVTWVRVVLSPVLAAAFAVALCYWPQLPPDQTGGSWIRIGPWPAAALELAYHPVATTLFLLAVGYTSAAALATLIGARSTPGSRAAGALLSLNVVLLLLAAATFSAISAQNL